MCGLEQSIFLPDFGQLFAKKSKKFEKIQFLTEIFFFKMKFETSPGVSKSKIWDSLGNFDHNLALKKGCKKEVYCRF